MKKCYSEVLKKLWKPNGSEIVVFKKVGRISNYEVGPNGKFRKTIK